MNSATDVPGPIERWDVVVVPFPFTDRHAGKRRPALVLSDAQFNALGHSILAMITTASHASWDSDIPIEEITAAGLRAPSVVRFNVFTLDNRLVLHRAGRLAAGDIKAVARVLRAVLP